MTNDLVSDMLTRIRNGQAAKHVSVKMPSAKLKIAIAKVLKEEGYIWNYEVDTTGKFPELVVKTKFVDGVPALTDLKRVSKCGRRKYTGSQEIPRVLNNMGISILSTSKGVMTGHQARKDKVGGEIIAFVW